MNKSKRLSSAKHIEQLLVRLKTDPTTVIELYPALTKGQFWTLTRPDTWDTNPYSFLIYSTQDGTEELPIFTSEKDSLLEDLQEQSQARIVCVEADALFTQLLEILADGTELVINPGSVYGIRINRSILLAINALLEKKH